MSEGIRIRGVMFRDADDALEALKYEEPMEHLYDEADSQEAQAYQLELERERQTCEALDECVAKGVSRDSLRVLARETGVCVWAMRNSLKG